MSDGLCVVVSPIDKSQYLIHDIIIIIIIIACLPACLSAWHNHLQGSTSREP